MSRPAALGKNMPSFYKECKACPGNLGFGTYDYWLLHLMEPSHSAEEKKHIDLREERQIYKQEYEDTFVIFIKVGEKSGVLPSRFQLVEYFTARGFLEEFSYDEVRRFCIVKVQTPYGLPTITEGQYLVEDEHLITCLVAKDLSFTFWHCLLKRNCPIVKKPIGPVENIECDTSVGKRLAEKQRDGSIEGQGADAPNAFPAPVPTDESIFFMARIRTELSLSIGNCPLVTSGCFIPGPPSIMFPDANILLGSSPLRSPVPEMCNNSGPAWGRSNCNPIPPHPPMLQEVRRIMPRRRQPASMREMLEVFDECNYALNPLHWPHF